MTTEPTRAALLALLALTGCQVEEWRNADLQLEIDGADLATTALVRVCVDDVGSRDVALGAGRVAYPGLPAEGPVTVTVDVLEAADTGGDAVRLGRAGPVSFDGQAWMETTWQACTEGCEPCRQADLAVDEADTRLLAVRFRDGG